MVERALERVGIAHLRDKVCHYLSGGEQRKVALAGALVLRARASGPRRAVRGARPRVARRPGRRCSTSSTAMHGVTLVMATHDVNVVQGDGRRGVRAGGRRRDRGPGVAGRDVPRCRRGCGAVERRAAGAGRAVPAARRSWSPARVVRCTVEEAAQALLDVGTIESSERSRGRRPATAATERCRSFPIRPRLRSERRCRSSARARPARTTERRPVRRSRSLRPRAARRPLGRPHAAAQLRRAGRPVAGLRRRARRSR